MFYYDISRLARLGRCPIKCTNQGGALYCNGHQLAAELGNKRYLRLRYV